MTHADDLADAGHEVLGGQDVVGSYEAVVELADPSPVVVVVALLGQRP